MSKKFLVPFEETLRGAYLVEAKSLKQAKRIVAKGDFAKEIWEARGEVFYSEDEIVELESEASE
jgi:hypothetical protein